MCVCMFVFVCVAHDVMPPFPPTQVRLGEVERECAATQVRADSLAVKVEEQRALISKLEEDILLVRGREAEGGKGGECGNGER